MIGKILRGFGLVWLVLFVAALTIVVLMGVAKADASCPPELQTLAVSCLQTSSRTCKVRFNAVIPDGTKVWIRMEGERGAPDYILVCAAKGLEP